MQDVCPECGAPTTLDEDFCGECGAYLEWEERGTPAPGPEAPAQQDEGPEQSRGLVERVKAAVGVGQPDPAAETAEPPPEPDPPPATTRANPAADAPPPEPASETAGADRPATGADALVVPVPPEPDTQPRQPTAVQPRSPAPRARRRTPGRDAEPIHHGDLVCGQCGAGNEPTRKFCRRCGRDLTEAEVAKVPWWRRVFQRRPRQAPVAGTRPLSTPERRLRVPGRLLVLVVALGALAGGLYLARGLAVGAFEAVLDRVEGTRNINPTSFRASDEQEGHPPGAARDGFTNRYWAPAAAGEGRGSSLVARFEKPFRLVYLLVTPGVSGEDEAAFLAHGRPAELRVVMTTETGAKEVEDLELEDKVGLATFNVATNDVVAVKIEILGSYGPAAAHTAIAEVEFRGRR